MDFQTFTPQLILSKPPVLSTNEASYIADVHDDLMRVENGGYDNDIIYLHHQTDNELDANIYRVFRAPYSWHVAISSNELPTLGQRISLLAVAGIIVNPIGDILIAKRAATMKVMPNIWSWSCAGGIDRNEWNSPTKATL